MRYALFVALFAAFAASAQPTSDRPSISTTGTAEIKVFPDQVELAVGVESVHENLQSAKTTNEQKLAAVVQAAKNAGVESDQIQMDFVGIDPQFDYEKRSTLPVRYIVRRSMNIVCKDVSKFEALLSAVVSAGANHVHSVNFTTSKLREHRDEARKMATKAALEKAQLLAESLGRRVGRPHTINEVSNYWGSAYSSWWGRWNVNANSSSNAFNVSGGSSASEESLTPGRIAVSATVNVTFDLD